MTAIPPAAQVTTVMPPPPEGPERRLGLWAGLGAAAVVLIVAAGWMATRPAPVSVTKTVEEPIAKPNDIPLKPPKPTPPNPEPVNRATTNAAGPPAEKKKSAPPVLNVPEPAKPVLPKPEPVNHAALGDVARNAGDLAAALRHYREAADPQRLAALQKAVEGDADESASALMDRGQFGDALKIADRWLPEFPASQRLTGLRAKIVRARDSQ